jgi:hypothetical protein
VIATAPAWPALQKAAQDVRQVAHILANHNQETSQQVRARLQEWLDGIQQRKTQYSYLSNALNHFVHTTNHFAKGLFYCYDVPDLPSTNNDLEQCFGSLRYHERRTTGRKKAVSTIVVRGESHTLAVIASSTQVFSAQDLRPRDQNRWRHLRESLSTRSYARCLQRRFRKDPTAYLADIEACLLHSEQLSP